MYKDRFAEEKKRLYESIQPKLVGMDFANEWAERRERLLAIMKQFDEEEKQLKASSTPFIEPSPIMIQQQVNSDETMAL